MKGTVNGVTTAYVGEILEWTGSTSTMVKYYYAGGTRVAMRNGTTLYWLIGDHLSSTSVVATSTGGLHSKMLYKAWGEVRYASASLPTRYTYTGQYSYMDDPATPGVTEGFGLMFYRSRWYDPILSRFAQADTLVPGMGEAQAWDRFSAMKNNPVSYSDSTGHFSENQIKKFLGLSANDSWEKVLDLFEEGGKYAGRWGWLETLRKAEIGDQITIEWVEGALPEGHLALDAPLTFGVDPHGNLILIGDGYFLGHEAAGLYGENYHLSHYADLSPMVCSPYECGYSTNFNTSAVHDPYLHRKMKWEQFGNPIAVVDLTKMVGMTVFTGVMTIAFVPIVLGACSTGVGCVVGVVAISPALGAGSVATYYMFQGTSIYFLHEFTDLTP